MERRKRKQIKSEIVKEVEEELEEKEVEEEVEKNNRTKRSRRSSTSQQVTVDDEEEDKETKSNLLNHFLPGCHNYHIQIPTIQLKQQQSIKWDRVSSDAAKGLAKSAARVLLFKGGHGDRVTMEHIRSSLGDYKQLTRPALKAAQQLLRNIFGLDVVLTKEPDNIYVVNTIQ